MVPDPIYVFVMQKGAMVPDPIAPTCHIGVNCAL